MLNVESFKSKTLLHERISHKNSDFEMNQVSYRGDNNDKGFNLEKIAQKTFFESSSVVSNFNTHMAKKAF